MLNALNRIVGAVLPEQLQCRFPCLVASRPIVPIQANIASNTPLQYPPSPGGYFHSASILSELLKTRRTNAYILRSGNSQLKESSKRSGVDERILWKWR
ncbi:hypothetical protein L596_014151 [Steinernema carpocapsae]|uniref:Uncharacterized protein n=1 Tax=Steinernema carpocapsae TaxID=34508 RepID=A0A4U5NC11_STECR|nr:hypothetical protein L596_014151 [Steinernema carpocapsae]